MKNEKDVEKSNIENDEVIKTLVVKVAKLEERHCEKDSDNIMESIKCNFCEFEAKNKRGLQLHMKAKHEIEKIELKVFSMATDDYLSIDRYEYKKELESEIDVLEDGVEIFIDASEVPRNEYLGFFYPQKLSSGQEFRKTILKE